MASERAKRRPKNSGAHSEPRAENQPAAGPVRDPKTGQLSGGNPGNSGGKKGRSGRKPGSWKKWCMKVVSGPSAAKAIRKVLRNPEHPAFGTMVKFIGEQGYGKAEASVNLKASSLEALIAGSMKAADDGE